MIKRQLSIPHWGAHVAFWLSSVYFIGSFFSVSNTVEQIDFFYSLLFHVPLVALVYTNLLGLVPRLLEKERYLSYGVAAIGLLGLAYGVHELTFEVLLPILPTGFYMVSFADIGLLIGIFATYLVLTTLLHLARSWYRLQQQAKEQLSTELGSLRAQLNPHFLFNSLNSIYSMALAGREETASAVLQLSDLLRYTLYEMKEEKVPLAKEVEVVQHYLALQRLRAESTLHANFQIKGSIEQKRIAPLLLFPLVENAFKHGARSGTDDDVDLLLDATEGVHFTITNSKGATDDPEVFRAGGIGLQNLIRRLQLIYPGRHELIIDEDEKHFTVKLSLA